MEAAIKDMSPNVNKCRAVCDTETAKVSPLYIYRKNIIGIAPASYIQ